METPTFLFPTQRWKQWPRALYRIVDYLARYLQSYIKEEPHLLNLLHLTIIFCPHITQLPDHNSEQSKNHRPSVPATSTFIRIKISQSIGSVQIKITPTSLDSTSSYESPRWESIEIKLYYLRGTASPVKFDEFVDNELQRVLSHQTTQSTSESFRKALRRFICFKVNTPTVALCDKQFRNIQSMWIFPTLASLCDEAVWVIAFSGFYSSSWNHLSSVVVEDSGISFTWLTPFREVTRSESVDNYLCGQLEGQLRFPTRK